MTRSTDDNLRLRDRARVAKDAQAPVFVSIHFNGSTGHNAQGTETLVHTNFSSRSARLSLKVQDAMLVATGLSDRNRSFDPGTRIKPQSLGVLTPSAHHASTAGCLVECSFLDRADEEQRLVTAAYRARIAKAICDGVLAHLVAEGVISATAAGPSFGDAIEVAAGSAEAVVAFQGLDVAKVGKGGKPAAKTKDANEIVLKPKGLFSEAFVSGGFTDMALLAGAAPWPDLPDFVAMINGLGLKHFAPDEFLFLGASNAAGHCAGKNSFPPRALWPRIKNTALMLDAIRSELGASIRILSCYRAEPYNSCIGGESASLHMEFNAIDFTCSAGTPETWRRVADRIRSSKSAFKGGIGTYPNRGFVHIDTRGTLANWVG
jgi:N-acetylmuramoyl-L-alanine amidase